MSKTADLDIERQEIIREAREMDLGISGMDDINKLREILEDVASSWNGEDDKCLGTGYMGGELVTEEMATTAQELIERIDALPV